MDASDGGDDSIDGSDDAPVGDGAEIVADGGAEIVADGGAEIVADGGAEIVADGGAEIVADGGDEISDDEVVKTAAEAAEQVIFSRYDRSEVTDVDIAVSFEDGILEVDVYVDADGDADPEQVADDAALAARGAVDDLFDEP
jgi:hypothetical protein